MQYSTSNLAAAITHPDSVAAQNNNEDKNTGLVTDSDSCNDSISNLEYTKIAISTLRLFCYNQIHAYPFSQVPLEYIKGFAASCVLSSLFYCVDYFQHSQSVDQHFPFQQMISDLDTALIVGGSAVSSPLKKLINDFFLILSASEIELRAPAYIYTQKYLCSARRQVLIKGKYRVDAQFAVFAISSSTNFEVAAKMSGFINDGKSLSDKAQAELLPVRICNLAKSWPAFQNWNSVEYLLAATNWGRRVVPVEIGSSYVSDSWSQKFCPFGELLQDWLSSSDGSERDIKYMAQHDLLQQITSLRKDVVVPDLIYNSAVFGRSNNVHVTMNSWVGPSGTISPLHTDPNNNILVQIVGYKYVRLYSPQIPIQEMYPRVEDNIDMSNTSEVLLERGCYGALFGDNDALDYQCSTLDDEGLASGAKGTESSKASSSDLFETMRTRMREKRNYRDQYDNFNWDSSYLECVLEPGNGLFIPAGWWHYVRSLSPSFSVNFWF
ncbi:uncharacterized protein V2V93DRAFT_392054 [Kockiozyma suomiensis]|uniref:uncharacterized protein n=1 Tax=Kockiozyma suomiensis TaxID=1337062 RepID=UPI003343003F